MHHLTISSKPDADHRSPCTMLSTAEALQEWDNVLKLLADIKAAPPDQHIKPAQLAHRINDSNAALGQDLATPIATWEQLLQKQVNAHAPLGASPAHCCCCSFTCVHMSCI
jgi:hypothetical protein